MRGRAGQRLPGYWIDDENLLRDEGVLFGLSCGDADSPETLQAMRETVACIEAHHERLAQRAAAALAFSESESVRLIDALTEADTAAGRERRAVLDAIDARAALDAALAARADARAARVAAASAERHAVPDALDALAVSASAAHRAALTAAYDSGFALADANRDDLAPSPEAMPENGSGRRGSSGPRRPTLRPFQMVRRNIVNLSRP